MTAPDGMAGSGDALRELALSRGEEYPGGANRALDLDDPDIAWFVESGSLDIFVVELAETVSQTAASGLKHMYRAGRDGLAFGIEAGPGIPALRFVAKATAGARLRRLRLSELVDAGLDDELAARVDSWVMGVNAAIVRDITLRPDVDHRLDGAGERELTGDAVIAARGGVVWVAAPEVRDDAETGSLYYLGTELLGDDGAGAAPVTQAAWLRLRGPGRTRLRGMTSAQLAGAGRLLPALAEFHRLVLDVEWVNRRLLAIDEANEHVSWIHHRQESESRARRDLASVLEPGLLFAAAGRSRRRAPDADAAMLTALDTVGAWEGIDFREPARRRSSSEPSLHDVLRASRARGRRVRLSAEDRWWRGDSGAMLAFERDGGRPVALLPSRLGGYRIQYADGRRRRLNARRARTLEGEGWCFHGTLPGRRPVTGGDLLRLVRPHLVADVARILALGLLTSLAALAPAVFVAALAGAVIPAGGATLLVQMTVLLAMLGVVGGLLQTLQGTTLIKLEARVSDRLGAAINDRLFKLPASFLRGFEAGDLARRVPTFRYVRDQISGSAVHALLSVAFLLPAFVLLFVYNAAIGWFSLAMGAILLIAGVTLGLRQLEPHRRRYAVSLQLASFLRQVLTGMGKLKAAGAQATAFALWARRYREQQRATLRVGDFDDHLVSLGAAAPAFVAAVLFWAAAQGFSGIAAADFLAIYVVSMVFCQAVARLGDYFATVAGILPGLEMVRPLLEREPEVALAGEDARIRGAIAFDQVSFRYDDGGPLVLDDVSIHAAPGEFIAIVGGSGAGKSTLLRLALGLAAPNSGAVNYDGRNLRRLNAASVRRQVGVVLQEDDLPGGTIGNAIIGFSNELDLDDAWRAARLAAVDKDIESMPMGMHTLLSESASTLSGGQTQRLRIAAALVRNPRILFLDEATNWLDNASQAQVMRSVEGMEITRVVIAHRLSTIRGADRIYVLDGGRLVQRGTFQELAEAEGPFRRLVQHQLA